MDFVLNYLNTTTIGLLSLFLFCLFLYNPFKKYKGKEAPRVAGAWPILGHLPLLSGPNAPHRTLGALAEKYGAIFTIQLGSKKALVINSWEIAKECFTTTDMVVSSRPKLVAIELMGYNHAMFGFAPYGPYWRELRKITTLEILTPRRVEQLQHVRVSEVQNSIRELYTLWCSQKGESGYASVELKQWFSHLTFNMVLRMLVGKRYFGGENVDDEKAQRCVKAVEEFLRLLGVFAVGDAIPWMRWLDFGGHEKAMKETAEDLDIVLCEWLEEHKQKKGLGEKVDEVQDFMDVMISFLDGRTIDGFDSDTVIKSTILALIAGGSGTSNIILTWTIYSILRNPLVLQKVKAELDIHVGKEKLVSEDDISNLKYLQATVKETLRLYPPSPLLPPREFTENCTLSGYNIEKGTRLITNVWKIQTDSNIWEDPLEFKPERFLTTHKEIDMRGHHFELLPFGSGRRICPGITFGLQMVHFNLATLLHSFEVLSSSPDLTSELIDSSIIPLEILIKPRLSFSCYENNLSLC